MQLYESLKEAVADPTWVQSTIAAGADFCVVGSQ